VVAYRLFKLLRDEYKLDICALAPGKNLCTGKVDTNIGFADDLNVVYLDTKRPIRSKMLKGLIFLVKTVLYLWKHDVGEAVVFSRSTPILSHIPALFTQKKKWIVSYSDPPSNGIFSGITNYLMRVLISGNADCILIPSKRMERYYQGFRTLYLPHFIRSDPKAQELNGYMDRVNYYHFGNIYGDRDCRHFLKALKDMPHTQGVAARLIVYGFVSKEILEAIQASDFSCYIEVQGYLNHSDYIEALKSVRNAVLFDMNLPNSPYMPSKLVEYLEYGHDITVVTTKSSEVAQIAQEHGLRLIYYDDGADTYIAKLTSTYERQPNKFNTTSNFMRMRIMALCTELIGESPDLV